MGVMWEGSVREIGLCLNEEEGGGDDDVAPMTRRDQ